MPWLLWSRLVAPVLLGIGEGFTFFLFTLTPKGSCHSPPPRSVGRGGLSGARVTSCHHVMIYGGDTIAAPVSRSGGWCYNSGSILGSTLGSRSRPWAHQRRTERLCLVPVMAKVNIFPFFFSLAHRKSGLSGIQPRHFFLWKVLK